METSWSSILTGEVACSEFPCCLCGLRLGDNWLN